MIDRNMPPEFFKDLERVEIKAFSDLFRAANQEDIKRCGIALPDLGPFGVTATSKIDVLAMNRVVGLGLEEPADKNIIGKIIKLYRELEIPRFFLQLHPSALPSSLLAGQLEKAGFRHYNNWVKLFRSDESFPATKTDLRIREIGPEHGDEFARIVISCFGWPEIMRPWLSNFIGHPNWRFYMAFDKGAPAATGAFFVDGKYAWIDFAATLPEFRGRGAQAAIAERRARNAAEIGCKWLVVETAEETQEHSAPSYRNMIRFGFQVAYVRPNYIYKFD